MRFDILTLFPEMFDNFKSESIIGRAVKNNLIEINTINIRDFSDNKHKKADDYPFGGGSGMVMLAQPIYDAYLSIVDGLDYKPTVIYLSPKGSVLTQQSALKIAEEKHVILLCGHYEGVDQRVLDKIVDYEISIGDYVLTGGEIPAMAVIDCVSRLIPGVLQNENSAVEESHSNNLLEYPQYTRPAEFMGEQVPEVLLSGNHKLIQEWRHEQSVEVTKKKRPDLYERYIKDRDNTK